MFDLLRSIRSPRRRLSRRRQFAAAFSESLEGRLLLAGNVSASVVDGDLVLTGDSRSNSVELTVEGADLVVRGRDGTTINDSTDDFVIATGGTSFAGDVEVDLRRGADTFRITGPVTIEGDVHSRDRSGRSEFAITGSTIEGDVQLRHGDSSDTVSLLNATLGGRLSLHLHNGRAFVAVRDSEVAGRMDVHTGNRNDVILLDGSTVGGLRAHTGSWIDDIIVQESTIDGSFFASTGADRDFVMMENSTVTGDTHLRLLRDSDTVVTQGEVDFEGDFLAGGILGRRDTIHLSDETTIGGRKKVKGFESRRLKDLTGINARIDRRLDEALQFQFALNALDLGDLTLTVDTSSNQGLVQSNSTLVTRADTFTITGTTLPGATVDVAAGPTGAINLGSTVAGSDGTYSITFDLLLGPTTIVVTATDLLDRTVSEQFNLHVAEGTVVRFDSSEGSFDVELYDDEAPQTVANFLNYAPDYIDSIVHRSAVTLGGNPFVIQGGGFRLNASDQLQMISTDPPVMSEFSGNSNVRGTLAMALSGGISGTDPDSGTSQWFVNLGDNSQLDLQEFTVFGEVIGEGMSVVDAIAALPRYDINDVIPLPTSALNEVPLENYMLEQVQLTGTVSIAAGSIQVNGTGTMFTTELSVNDIIEIEGDPYRILQINSDTQLLVDASPMAAIMDVPFVTEPIAVDVPTRDQYVVFNSIGVLL